MKTEFNIENYLNTLPENITEIYLGFKNLTYLPNISRFTYLKILICYHNNLTFLPELPNTLEILFCDNNQLTSLPELPKNLNTLYCYNNQLTSLPELPESLEILICNNNKLILLPLLPDNLIMLTFNNNVIYDIVYDSNNEIIKKNIKTIHKFRKLHYFIKIKYWLYKYVLQEKIKEKYHPKNLISLLNNNNNSLENVLENWY